MIARRKEKRAAAVLERPAKSPAVIVMPERDVPGMSATACARPTNTASFHPMRPISLFPGLLSAAQSTSPHTMEDQPIISRVRKGPATRSWAKTPATATGMVAASAIHASAPLWFPSNLLSARLLKKPLLISTMSLLKYITTASHVAVFNATSKASPWSGQSVINGTSMR